MILSSLCVKIYGCCYTFCVSYHKPYMGCWSNCYVLKLYMLIFLLYKYYWLLCLNYREKFNIEFTAAHAVTIKKHFSFHHLVLQSEVDLLKIYTKVEKIGFMRKRPSALDPQEVPYFTQFNNRFFYHIVSVGFHLVHRILNQIWFSHRIVKGFIHFL